MATKNVIDSTDEVMLNKATIEYALKYVEEEMQTLFALAFSLAWQIGAPDDKNPKDTDNICAYRLANVISERTGTTKFGDSLRYILTGSSERLAAADQPCP